MTLVNTPRLKIGVDARPLAHSFSGIGVYLTAVLALMSQNSRHRWYLYSNTPVKAPSARHSAQHELDERNVCYRSGQSSSRWQSSLFAQIQYPRWAREDQLDVFWSPRHQLPLGLPRSLPTVVTLHDLVFRTHPETMTRGGALLERILTPASLKRATRILTTSNAMLDELRTEFPGPAERATVARLSSSIDTRTKIIQPDIGQDTRYALFCGSIEPRKNLERLIEAVLQVNQTAKEQPLHLVIVTGGGWKNEAVEQLIAANPSLIHVRQGISESAKAGFYQNAWCLALPSLSEGFGLPVVEAMKFGLPIITSRRGALPEVAGDAALYVDPESVQSISAGLELLMDNPATREQLRSTSRKRSNLFSWQRCAQQTLTTLEDTARIHL